jgi:hypothetical protein
MKSGIIPTQYFVRIAPLKMAQVDRFPQKLEPIGESESVHCPLLSKFTDSNQAWWCVSEVISCHGIRRLPEVRVLFVYIINGTKRQKEKPRFS